MQKQHSVDLEPTPEYLDSCRSLQNVRAIALLCWLGCFVFSFVGMGCVLDPELLFPQEKEQVQDASAKPEVTQSEDYKKCYYDCIRKGVDAKLCRQQCQDKTRDCYNPCVKAGSSPGQCGAKCYGTMKPEDTCFLSCRKGGGTLAYCSGAMQHFSVCVKGGTTESLCRQKCAPNPIQECYSFCLKTGTNASVCKQTATKYSACVKEKSPEDCIVICKVK